VSTVIAFRVLAHRGSDSPVIISIFAPQEITQNHWRCALSITGEGLEAQSAAYGVDGLQALCMALEMMKTELRLLGPKELTFDGNPNPLIGLSLSSKPDAKA
jgi:hypothetical protein